MCIYNNNLWRYWPKKLRLSGHFPKLMKLMKSNEMNYLISMSRDVTKKNICWGRRGTKRCKFPSPSKLSLSPPSNLNIPPIQKKSPFYAISTNNHEDFFHTVGEGLPAPSSPSVICPCLNPSVTNIFFDMTKLRFLGHFKFFKEYLVWK